MADFHALLARAVASLPDPTRESRLAVYARARTALLQQLRGMDPPLAEADIARQEVALDEAIARVEAHYEPPRPASDNDLGEAFALRPSLSEEPPARSAPVDRGEADGLSASPVSPEPLFPPRPRLAMPESTDTQEEPTSPRERSTAFPPLSGGRPGFPGWDRPPEPGAPGERPVLQVRASEADTAPRRRAIVLGGVIGAVILGIAALAIGTREQKPRPIPASETAGQGQTAGAETKFDDRVGGRAAPSDGRAPAQRTEAPRAESTPPANPGRSDVAVAQRAYLVEEPEPGAQQPALFGGRALWRADLVNVGQGQPAENAVRADLEIPEAGLAMSFVLRRNTDPTLPASHLIQISFARTASGTARAVRDVAVPEFKIDEGARGAPLSGLVVPVTEDVFLVGLANIPTEVTRNVEMMRARPWIDVRLRYANGKRAILTFEKGASGERILAETLDSWR